MTATTVVFVLVVFGIAAIWLWVPWIRAEDKKRAEEKRAKGVEVGHVDVVLHLKDGTTVDLYFDGSYHEFGDLEWVTTAYSMFDRWMERCGKLGMYSYDRQYINIDLVKEITYKCSKRTVKHEDAED